MIFLILVFSSARMKVVQRDVKKETGRWAFGLSAAAPGEGILCPNPAAGCRSMDSQFIIL